VLEQSEVLPKCIADWVDGGIAVHIYNMWDPLFHLPSSLLEVSSPPAAEKKRIYED